LQSVKIIMNKKDYFDELGEIALGSRLKRLSDKVMSDATRIYKYTGHDMQPRWFTLMSLLADKKTVSVVEAAGFLGLSQPCISQFSREMFKANLIQFKSDPDDLRRKIMSLSKNGKTQYKKMSKVRKAVRSAAKSMCSEEGQDFYRALKRFEAAWKRKSLYQRTMENYQ